MVLPLNSGVEAVEAAIKLARKWGYEVKGVADNQAEIIVCGGNFHGRTTTVISFSSEPKYRKHFGPFTPGFKFVPFGDMDALVDAVTPNTVAFLIEPIQGENGINVPPDGYLKFAETLCRREQMLLITDEIQVGLGRTGKLLASQHDKVRADIVVLGKALSGGFYPVSAILADRPLMGLFHPGDHGSTFGGNPLGVAWPARARAGGRAPVENAPGRTADGAAPPSKAPHPGSAGSRACWSAWRSPMRPTAPLLQALAERRAVQETRHSDPRPPLIIDSEQVDWLAEQVERSSPRSRRRINSTGKRTGLYPSKRHLRSLAGRCAGVRLF